MQEAGANMADFDDDETGLVSHAYLTMFHLFSVFFDAFLLHLVYFELLLSFISPVYGFTLILLICVLIWWAVLECTVSSTSYAEIGSHWRCFKVILYPLVYYCFLGFFSTFHLLHQFLCSAALLVHQQHQFLDNLLFRGFQGYQLQVFPYLVHPWTQLVFPVNVYCWRTCLNQTQRFVEEILFHIILLFLQFELKCISIADWGRFWSGYKGRCPGWMFKIRKIKTYSCWKVSKYWCYCDTCYDLMLGEVLIFTC